MCPLSEGVVAPCALCSVALLPLLVLVPLRAPLLFASLIDHCEHCDHLPLPIRI